MGEAKFRKVMLRESIEELQDILLKDRVDTYGDPENCFNLIADFWNGYINAKHKTNIKLTSEDVAMCMVFLKSARVAQGAPHADNFRDLAGYALLAGICGN